MKRTLLVLLVISALPNAFFAQNIFHHLELNVGYGVQKQDRRFYNPNYGYHFIQNADQYYDHQLDINLNATVLKASFYEIATGVGYSFYRSTFTRPFEATYFGDYFQVIHYSGTYDLHNLSTLLTNKYVLNSDGKNAISFLCPLRADFTFDKHMITDDGGESLNRTLFEFNKFEIYMGLQGKIHRITCSLLYRVYSYQRIDPVLDYSLAFNGLSPDHEDDRYEVKNFYKLMLNVGYIF